MPPIRVFVDLDEVLEDFTGAALRLHGYTRESFEKLRTPGVYDITKPLKMTLEEFNKPINEMGEAFWLGLAPLPWHRELVNLVERWVKKEWYILTSTMDYVGEESGKKKWCKRLLGRNFDRIIITKHKHVMSMPSSILIDDNPTNIYNWEGDDDYNTGEGFLFPSWGNGLYKVADHPLDTIRRNFHEYFAG